MWTLVILTLASCLPISSLAHQSPELSEGNHKITVYPVRIDTQGIIYPRHLQYRRRGQITWHGKTRYRFQAFNRTLVIELQPYYQVLKLNSTKSEPRARIDSGCYYKGRVLREALSSVKVSLCEGMTGDIRTSLGNYVIHPSSSRLGDSIMPHHLSVLENPDSERPWRPLHAKGIQFCGFEDEFADPEVHEALINATDGKGDKILSRKRRSESKELHLEVLVVADSKMASYHGRNLKHYILTLMSTVALIYKDPSIGNNINIAVVDIVVLDEATDRKIINPFAPHTLKNFCKWQERHNRLDDRDPAHYDTAILITREDLCKYQGSCDTLGLAQSGLVCHPLNSCAIVEDNGLSAAFTIAHELGHVMSLQHDDDSRCLKPNDREKKLHVMARMLDYNSNPWTWSECSREQLTAFFDGSQGRCLTDKPSRNLLLQDDEFQQPPGQLYPRDRQCELVFGPRSRICPYMPECKRLWCTMDDATQGGCRTQHMPWADGTQCSETKRCFQGECVRYRPANLTPRDGQWGKWKPYGDCSRTCGGGIQQAVRECNSPKPANGGRYCTGIRVKYKSCNTEECPPDSRDFREEQCAEFDGSHLNLPGLSSSVRWVPQYTGFSPNDKCKLYCKVAGSASYFILRDKVIDGTPCDLGSFSLCVNGNCESAGCDHILGSSKTLDRCGMCGGDNSTCKEITGHFNKKLDYGYHNVVMIPPGASNIHIKQHSSDGKVDDNYIALKDPGEKYILNGGFMISMFPKTLLYHGIMIDYSGSDSVVEYVNSSKPLPKDLFVQVFVTLDQLVGLTLSKNEALLVCRVRQSGLRSDDNEVLVVGKLQPPNISFSYTVPISDYKKYSWKLATQYSECSRMCNGISTLKPICVRLSDQYPVNDNHCAKHLKPRLQKTRKCNEYCVLKWQDVSKAECSVQCGRGKRDKMIKCMKEDIHSQIAHVVPEEYCLHLGPKPSSEESCWGSCLNSSWTYSDWSECSVTCGKGVQHRSSECRNSENIKQPDSHCDPSIKVTSRECDQGQCPYWSVGNWTECSVTCGSGIKNRPLWCQHEKKYVDSRYCKKEDIPNTIERCTVGECYSWDTEEWESCSVSCGEGVSKRHVYCRSSYEEVNDSHCMNLPRPAAFKNCSTGIPCASNIISKENISEQQIRERMRTQRIIGHTNTISEFFHAIWREGVWTKCSNSCGEGTKRRSVTCNNLEDGSRLPPSHCDPKLKPKTLEKCFSQECNHWEVGEWSECLCQRGVRERQVLCITSKGELGDPALCGLEAKPSDSEVCVCSNNLNGYDDNASVWKTGPWAECSVSCGNGIKRRQVLCYADDGSYSSNCDTSRKPSETLECSNGPCPDWSAEEWSECSTTCGKGDQVRRVHCYNDSGQRIPDIFCDISRKPEVTQQCMKQDCHLIEEYKWLQGPWSQCSVTCGLGVQHRNVDCINSQGHKQNHNNCPDPVPPSTRSCQLRSCPTWQWSEWTECPASCGFNEQFSHPHCVSDERVISDEDCFEPKPPPRRRQCKRRPECSFKWHKGTWSQCHASCGLTYKTREIVCVDHEYTRVSDEFCVSQHKPKRKRKCNLKPCPYKWETGPWSECSKSCGEGLRSRAVTCHAVNIYGWVDPKPLKNPKGFCLISRRPRQTEKCNYGHCSDGFVWRPDPWLQCEGRCQNAKQKRKLRCYTLQGHKVPNNKCNPLMKPQKRRRCTNSPKCQPESCLDFRNLQNRRDDGDYQIYIKGKMVTVYCHGMNTQNPQEYINLIEHNFAVIYSSALNFKFTSSDSCLSNDVTNQCDCNRNDYGYTEFFKVALNRTSLTLITDDFTFSTTFYGKPVPYAKAGDCFRRPTCPQGAFSVSLKGTDFYVASSAKWMSKSGSIHATIHRTENDQVIHGKCGGFCDTCGPDPKVGLALDVFMFT